MSLFLGRIIGCSLRVARSALLVPSPISRFTSSSVLLGSPTQPLGTPTPTTGSSTTTNTTTNTTNTATTTSINTSSAGHETIPETTSFFYSSSHDRDKPFRLSKDFVSSFRNQRVPFGFNGLGELVYLRTYSRLKEDGSNEQWYETVERVVNGTYNMQKRWIEQHGLGWNARRAQRSAQEMYSRIFSLKFLPPGRGLWAMGSPLTEERGLYAALNNCAFVSTEHLKDEPHKPFSFLMDASMLGVGVGFDTKGAGTTTVRGPNSAKPTSTYIIPDSREGWVESVAYLIDSYFSKTSGIMQFDYSRIRPKGLPIRGFGGVSSGHEVLKELHESIREILNREIGKPISATAIVDVMNLIGRCVVAGNVRRTAEIAFGDPDSEEFLDLKNYDVNPQRMDYGWTSNNSVFARLGMDYKKVCERVRINGEPGFAWLENMQAYGLMDGLPDYRDFRAMGGNPCLEQTLESYELCCLVETFPTHHDDLDDFCKTLKYAYLYAKTVTLGKTHWPETNRVMLRNRRIGCSMSGIAQFVTGIGKRKSEPGVTGIHELRDWCTVGYQYIQEYDKRFSDWLAIPRSIKTTSIKPSGTVSLLAGVTPGMHYPESRFYIRRVRLSAESNLIQPLKEAGYNVVPAVGMCTRIKPHLCFIFVRKSTFS
eukprot:TRINITY_DN3778_c0_g5_i1.p1 TRINITY_DN3778_c0_g5~~TRINITY_DN3778_c0_g5_i1.p1  ORF type:complete len:651 (+),score=106.40 TRINITY_DN3778_c0_g5_i1:72-2024(+)